MFIIINGGGDDDISCWHAIKVKNEEEHYKLNMVIVTFSWKRKHRRGLWKCLSRWYLCQKVIFLEAWILDFIYLFAVYCKTYPSVCSSALVEEEIFERDPLIQHCILTKRSNHFGNCNAQTVQDVSYVDFEKF